MKKAVFAIGLSVGLLRGAIADTVVFFADFDAASAISGSVTANASAANLNAGTSVGSWSLPAVNPGAIVSDGVGNNAFMFDRVVSGSVSNTVAAVFSRSVALAGGEALVLEMDLYAARQSGSQRIELVLADAEGNRAYEWAFRMNNYKDFYTVNASGSADVVTANPVQYLYLNPAVDAYLSWGTTMHHVKIEVGSQPSQAGNHGARLSVDWNGDGDYFDAGEQVDADFGARSSGVLEISSLRLANSTSVGGGAWIDNVSATAVPGSVQASFNHFNLAKFQARAADSNGSATPAQFANDGFVSQDSRWVSGSTGPHWLEIELATPMAVGSAHLFSGGAADSAVADVALQYHNGVGWSDIPGAVLSGNSSPELNLVFDAPVTAQKFRLYSTDATARVRELALYPPTVDGSMVPFGADLDLNMAKLRQFSYSSVDGAHYPVLAIDGYVDDSSAWASTNAAGPHDFEVHLPQAESIRGIHLYSGYEGVPGSQIQNLEVSYYNGGWVLFDGGAVSGNTNQNLNLRFNAAATTTKIRVRSLGAGQAVIRELVVLPENGGAGYPLWTDAKDAAPPAQSFLDYEDSYYTIENRANGQNLFTAAGGASVTANEPWFQVLLNIGTDTYRLRSKDGERCFEVALASTNAGAAIVEGTYSSMPHQRWRLEDTGNGSHFRIVNVWSGLVLGLEGTNVMQQAYGPEFSKQWKFNYETHSPKKGQASHLHFNSMYKPGWAYNWKYDGENLVDHGQYMPMQWGGIGASAPGILNEQPEWYGRANQTTVLGFNEPDLSDQSNMTEETAAYQWPRMERMRLPLGGPVPAAYKGAWRQGYEALAAERGLRSEYMAMHWYSTSGASTGSPGTLISNMQTLFDTYGKPIWLTEFSTRDFVGDKTTWSRNHNYNFLAEFMWRAESLPWLKKWSLFEWGISGGDPATTDASSDDPFDMNSPRLSLHYNNDSTDPGWEDLAECGLLLAGWDGQARVVDETAYIIHNKGSFLRLIDHPASNSVATANVLNRIATEQFMVVSAPNGNKYITGLSDGRRLSCSGSGVGLAAAGTTGASVEWELNEYQYGWFYIDHPATGKRLRIPGANAVDAVADSTLNDTVRFRFIKHYLPITLTEVQTLPYAESFENGIGAWRQFYDQDKFWEVGRGGTPTAAAGPDGASDGEYYLFSEGHDAGPYVTNRVECVFDLGMVAPTTMTFDYHLCGQYIALLAVDVFDGSTWTSNVWAKSGPLQASSIDPWATAAVDLSPYAGHDKVTIRFRTANGLWNAADPAIDNIRIERDATQTLPYAESFESGFGAWTQSAEDDFDWTRWSGYTVTTNTGPSAASDGSWYLYIEGHDNYDGHNKTAQIESLFDLSTATYPELMFDYHMYGANIDYLAVDVSDGTSWSSNVWMRSGSVHTSSESAWSNAVVDLSAYAGNREVTIRFRAKQGYWHVSDVAIDHILVREHVYSPYDLWAEEAFRGAPAETDTTPAGNPDADANANELEWILATDPLVADSPIGAMSFNDPNWIITYSRRKLDGIRVYAEHSPALVSPSWETNGFSEVVIGDDGTIETVAVILPSEPDQEFIRLRVRH